MARIASVAALLAGAACVKLLGVEETVNTSLGEDGGHDGGVPNDAGGDQVAPIDASNDAASLPDGQIQCENPVSLIVSTGSLGRNRLFGLARVAFDV